MKILWVIQLHLMMLIFLSENLDGCNVNEEIEEEIEFSAVDLLSELNTSIFQKHSKRKSDKEALVSVKKKKDSLETITSLEIDYASGSSEASCETAKILKELGFEKFACGFKGTFSFNIHFI